METTPNNINLILRSEILEVALILEDEVTKLLISCLAVDKENKKAISNKNTSLTFKNKIDLLFDIDIFNKEDYSKFLLLMEFRNQFLHNIYCNTFEKAIEMLGNDRAKALLKFDDINFEVGKEYKYLHAYKGMFIYCLDRVAHVYETKHLEAETRRNALINSVDYSRTIIDSDTKLILRIMEKCFPSEGDSKKLVSFKLDLISFIEHQSNNLVLDKYKDLKEDLEKLRHSKEFKKLING